MKIKAKQKSLKQEEYCLRNTTDKNHSERPPNLSNKQTVLFSFLVNVRMKENKRMLIIVQYSDIMNVEFGEIAFAKKKMSDIVKAKKEIIIIIKTLAILSQRLHV